MSTENRAKMALLAIILAFSLTACTKEETRIVSPTDPDTLVVAAGACEADGSSINCDDESVSEPTGRLSSVTWTLKRGSATEVASKTAGPDDPVTFGPNLPTGTYSVEQKVVAKDGTSAKKTYPNIVVDGF